MAEVSCVRVDPPAKRSSEDVILRILERTGGVIMNPASIASHIAGALDRREADNPEPTYRIELDAEAFETLRSGSTGALNALYRSLDRCADGEVPRTAAEQFAYETIKGWAGSAPMADPAGATDSSRETKQESAVESPNRCPGHTVTAEELAEVIGKAWQAHPRGPSESFVEAARVALARFFPEHVAAFQPKVRAKVTNIGTANPATHEARFWVMEGGDYAGLDIRTGLLGGWNIHELAAIAERAKVIGTHGAVNEANQRRRLPPEVLPCCVSIPWAEVLAEAEDNQ